MNEEEEKREVGVRGKDKRNNKYKPITSALILKKGISP
jgi:hypothetical protein